MYGVQSELTYPTIPVMVWLWTYCMHFQKRHRQEERQLRCLADSCTRPSLPKMRSKI